MYCIYYSQPRTVSKTFNLVLYMYHAREPLYANSAVIALWLQSTNAQDGVPSSLER